MGKIFVIGILLGAPAGAFALNAFAGKPEANIPPTIVTEVIERDGNIYSIDKSGKEIPLTSSGVDFEPSLSTDEEWVTFVRENPSITIHSGVADCPDEFRSECLTPAREIWVMASDGSQDPRLVVSREHFENGILDNFRRATG